MSKSIEQRNNNEDTTMKIAHAHNLLAAALVCALAFAAIGTHAQEIDTDLWEATWQ